MLIIALSNRAFPFPPGSEAKKMAKVQYISPLFIRARRNKAKALRTAAPPNERMIYPCTSAIMPGVRKNYNER